MKTMELAAVASTKRRRCIIYVLVFGIALINYWDRAVLSIAIPVLTREFHMTTVTAGYLLSAFVFTYAIAQLPAGIVLDWLGTRRTGAGSLAVWSTATALTVCATGVVSLFVMRLLLGLGESVTMPLTARAVREWAPVRERGFAQAFVHSGLPVGTAIASVVVGATVGVLGWRTAFVLSGLMGLIWAVIWFAVYREPTQCRWLDTAERELILLDRPTAPARRRDKSAARSRPLDEASHNVGAVPDPGLRQLRELLPAELAAELFHPHVQHQHQRFRAGDRHRLYLSRSPDGLLRFRLRPGHPSLSRRIGQAPLRRCRARARRRRDRPYTRVVVSCCATHGHGDLDRLCVERVREQRRLPTTCSPARGTSARPSAGSSSAGICSDSRRRSRPVISSLTPVATPLHSGCPARSCLRARSPPSR